MNHVCFTLNNLSAYLNFLYDLKILSKMVPNGSNLMRFYITVKKKNVACMGNIDTKGQGEQNEQQVNNLLKHKRLNKSSYKI